MPLESPISRQRSRAAVLAIREKMIDLQAAIERTVEEGILFVEPDPALVSKLEEACTELGMSLTFGLTEEDQLWVENNL